MPEILLPSGDTVLVDEFNLWLGRWKWHKVTSGRGGTSYAARRDPKTREYIFMHNEILCPSPELEIDHIDGNGLNNLIVNLRRVSHSTNVQNRRKRKGTSSQFIGVTLHKKSGKWISSIKKNGISYYLGFYINEEDAADAYDKKAVELYGHDAQTNKSVQKF